MLKTPYRFTGATFGARRACRVRDNGVLRVWVGFVRCVRNAGDLAWHALNKIHAQASIACAP